jgi:hypothetical protein
MANYEINLSPNITNPASEGSMDTSLMNGKSIQRTCNGMMIVNGVNRKMVGRLADGDTFDNVIEGVKAGVYILINRDYVDYRETNASSSREANNVIAIMDSTDISYETFTDISVNFFGNLSSSAKLLIPEIEEDDLNPDLSSAARTAINTFVNSGGTIIMFHPRNGDPLNVLNAVFNFSLDFNEASEPIVLTTEGASLGLANTLTLPDLSATSSIDTLTLPENAVTIYEGDEVNQSVVTMIPYGSGKIYVLGWDFYNAPPVGGEEEEGWNHLLETILKS